MSELAFTTTDHAERRALQVDVRMLSLLEGGAAADREAFLGMIAAEYDRFQANDLWGLPTTITSLRNWCDRPSRTVVGAFDAIGDCYGFAGADVTWDFSSGDPREWHQLPAVASLFFGVAQRSQGHGLAQRLSLFGIAAHVWRHHRTENVRMRSRTTNAASLGVARALGLLKTNEDEVTCALVPGAPKATYRAFDGSVDTVEAAMRSRMARPWPDLSLSASFPSTGGAKQIASRADAPVHEFDHVHAHVYERPRA